MNSNNDSSSGDVVTSFEELDERSECIEFGVDAEISTQPLFQNEQLEL
jgi:hypothetical protein